jgi:acyl-CoA thioesterase-1
MRALLSWAAGAGGDRPLDGYGAQPVRRNPQGREWRACALAAMLALAVPVTAGAQDAPLRLVALGDSLTQGYGLQQGLGLVPRLQNWLDARGPNVTVVNAGVSGDTTAGGRARLDWTLADDPDAMIVALGGNDLLRGFDPGTTRDNLDAILARLREEEIPALLVGLSAPGNYGPEWQAEFNAIFPDLAGTYDTGLLPDMLAPLSEAVGAGQPMDALMQSDGIHPAPAGVDLIVEALGPQVEALLERVTQAEAE